MHINIINNSIAFGANSQIDVIGNERDVVVRGGSSVMLRHLSVTSTRWLRYERSMFGERSMLGRYLPRLVRQMQSVLAPVVGTLTPIKQVLKQLCQSLASMANHAAPSDSTCRPFVGHQLIGSIFSENSSSFLNSIQKGNGDRRETSGHEAFRSVE